MNGHIALVHEGNKPYQFKISDSSTWWDWKYTLPILVSNLQGGANIKREIRSPRNQWKNCTNSKNKNGTTF